MKRIVGLLFASFVILGAASYAQGQVVVIDLTRAKLSWVWAPGPGAVVANGFNVKCGTATGTYTRITNVANVATTTVDVKSAIAGNGNWFCVVAPHVQTASGPLEGAGSNEVNFFAAVAPSGSIVLSITP